MAEAKMTDYSKLKVCPCCGEEPVVQNLIGTQFPWRIFCKWFLCGMSTPQVKIREAAVEIWNRRRKAPKRAPRNNPKHTHVRNGMRVTCSKAGCDGKTMA